MQIINFYKKKKKQKKNRRTIWKLSGEWSCFVRNVLVGVKDVSTYKKIYIYLFSLVYIYIYI